MIHTHLFCISVFLMGFLFPFLILLFMNMILWIHVHVHSVVPLRIIKLKLYSYVCLYVFVHVHPNWENFTWWRATNFDLYSALMAMEHWGFFNVRATPSHGASVYNCHLRGPVTLKPVAEYLAVELSLPVLRWYGTPCNIYKDERVRLHLPQKMHFWNLTKEIKTKTGTRFEPATHGLLDYTSTT